MSTTSSDDLPGRRRSRRVRNLISDLGFLSGFETSSWKERAERFRLQEWLLHEEMLQAAFAAARELRKHPARASLHDLVKLYDLASVLGRRACGMPLDPTAAPRFEPPFARLDVEAALDKIYGPENQGPAQARC